MNKLLIALLIPLTLTACVNNPGYGPQGYGQPQQGYNPHMQQSQPYANVSFGRVVSVQDTMLQPNQNDINMTGALIGGAVGLLAGSQVGKGKGNTAATIVGTAGGAYAGNEIAKRNAQPVPAYVFNVKLGNGQHVQVIQPRDAGYFRVGDQVRVTYGPNGQPSLSY